MPKYRKYFREMMEQNQKMLTEFKDLHDKYEAEPETYQEEYNKQGKEVVEVIREWEKRLCGHMEKGDNARYSSSLADKYWNEVRAYFPMIDYVGVTYS